MSLKRYNTVTTVLNIGLGRRRHLGRYLWWWPRRRHLQELPKQGLWLFRWSPLCHPSSTWSPYVFLKHKSIWPSVSLLCYHLWASGQSSNSLASHTGQLDRVIRISALASERPGQNPGFINSCVILPKNHSTSLILVSSLFSLSWILLSACPWEQGLRACSLCIFSM